MSARKWRVNNAESAEFFNSAVLQAVLAGKTITYSIEVDKRSTKQQAALEIWCRGIAEALNDGGLSMQKVLEAKSVDIEWTGETVKSVLFRPILKAIAEVSSTADAGTKDYDVVRQTLTRHLGENLGVTCPPWPSRFSEGMEEG